MSTSPTFMPHGMCYLWDPRMLLLHVASDAAIALAYFSIPLVLAYFLSKRRDVPFGGTIAMFGLFIVACGATHVLAIWTIWHASFWLDGVVKALTATVSLITAAVLVPLVPKALQLRTPAQLDVLNARLSEDLRVREDALAQSERSFVELAEAMPNIVFTATADGDVDFYNERWYEYTGMTLEQTKGWGWEPVIHPDDLQGCLAAWTAALAQGTLYEIEYRFKRGSDGSYRWYLGRALPARNLTGAITKWIGTCTDIDAQKQAAEAAGRLAEQMQRNETLQQDIAARLSAEIALRASDERFRQVEQYAPIGLALVALDGTFMRVNPALCALTGYREDELLATTFQALTHPDDLEADLVHVERLLAGQDASYEMEKRYLHKGRRVVWVLLSVSLVRAENGAPNYFIAQIQDIEARKDAEQTVKAAQRAASAANEAKSRFLATMSHEIRTPMNGIIGMNELLSFTQLSEEQREYVTVVRDSGKSLLRVLNDILDYSKIEAGKLEFEHIDFDVASQIASVTALLQRQFSVKGVSLTTYIADDVPPSLNGDPGRVRQILINLVGNALKYTSGGGNVQILVRLESRGGSSTTATFEVVDTGVGIAPEQRHRLFQPFSQVDSSTTRKYGGTGLGLSICKQLVGLMHGEMGVTSTLGSGSSFWFSIPFGASDVRKPVLPAPAREMGERRGPVKARRERLLLAEDNEVNMLLAIKQFNRLGFNVTVVADGKAALEAARLERFDAIFMDCHMPEMDGFEATRAIRELPSGDAKRIPIVAMTANAQDEDRQACLAAGMDDYLAKPVSLADLRSILERWLALPPDASLEDAPAPRS